MISREGMETALLLMQLHETTNLLLGAALGSVAAAGVAWLWSRFGHRVNLQLFFQATAIFLFVFVVQLLIKGTHEMSEAGYLPYSEIIHSSTEAWGPDSLFGHVLTYLLVVLPLAWIAIKSFVSKSPIFAPAPSHDTKEPQRAATAEKAVLSVFAISAVSSDRRPATISSWRNLPRSSTSPGSTISCCPGPAATRRSRSTAPASPDRRRCRRSPSRSPAA